MTFIKKPCTVTIWIVVKNRKPVATQGMKAGIKRNLTDLYKSETKGNHISTDQVYVLENGSNGLGSKLKAYGDPRSASTYTQKLTKFTLKT